ncbi:hypothetical protein T07_2465 [Trichinella nelsoni]|uniref:Uncharacterized protein n=1 Tax=Trichinella nelsoni TaxID=6336 RepID=A0A0V0S447_9BILA|nr:hypothetical protein T07_2465 [Trichinella nelsoni]
MSGFSSLIGGRRVTSIRCRFPAVVSACPCSLLADWRLFERRIQSTLICHPPATFPSNGECRRSAASSIAAANADCPGGLSPTCDNRVVRPEPSGLRRRACSGPADHLGPCSKGSPVIHFFKPRSPASCRLVRLTTLWRPR